MQPSSIITRSLIVSALLITIGLGTLASVAGSSSVSVYDHGFAEGVQFTGRGNLVIANRTTSFTEDVRDVYAFLTAAYYSANFTDQWYDPTGQLYYKSTLHADCVASPCGLSFTFPVAGTSAATRFGTWRMDLLVDGNLLYSDYFELTSVITQDDYWKFDVKQSAPFRASGELTVTIHPNNQTWSFYRIALPYAANVTAHESQTNQALKVTTFNGTGLVIVDLAVPQSNGFSLILNFDMTYGLVGDWTAGNFVLGLQEYSWQRQNDAHPIPEAFNITLPVEAAVVDVVGMNVLALNYDVVIGMRPSISFSTTLSPYQRFGWTIIYRDFTYQDAHPNSPPSTASANVPLMSDQPIPVLPLSLSNVSLWSAIMSVFLLTGSELLSPVYSRTGILINRRRLRIAGLILVAIFLITIAYQIMIFQSAVLPK